MNKFIEPELYNEKLKFVLENIYLNLFETIIHKIKYKFDINYIYNTQIPDFISNNESFFNNIDSIEYKIFINNKIEDYFINKNNYKHYHSVLINFKLCDLIKNSKYNNISILMYNILLNHIVFLHRDYLFCNMKSIKNNDNTFNLYYTDSVFDSSIFIINQYISFEYLEKFLFKLFLSNKYELLIKEFEFLDNLIINSDNYNNLKYTCFRVALSQYIQIDPQPLDLTKLFDYPNIPDSNSIFFSFYMAWYIGQRMLKNDIPNNIIIDTQSKINKFYNYFIQFDNDTFWKLFNFIENDEREFRDTNDYFDEFNIEIIFDENNNFVKVPYDYVENLDTNNYELKIVNNKYVFLIKENEPSNNINTKIYKELLGGDLDNYKIINVIPFYKIFNIIRMINK